MPAIAQLSLADSVPVTRVYNPDRIDGGLATFIDRDTNNGIIAGVSPLTMSLQRPSKTSKLTKSRVKIVLPRLNADNTLARSLTADVNFLLPESSTDQERGDLLALLISTLQTTEVSALVVNNESLY